jgi:hypothetical protein
MGEGEEGGKKSISCSFRGEKSGKTNGEFFGFDS